MAQGCTEVGRWLSGDLRTAMWYRRTVVLGEAHTTQELAPMPLPMPHRTFCAVWPVRVTLTALLVLRHMWGGETREIC